VTDASRQPRIDANAVAAAGGRITSLVERTPVLPHAAWVRTGEAGRSAGVWLKLECLQPIGSFKLRGAANAILGADRKSLEGGVYTGSAGNMAQGVAYVARELGLPCRVIVPDSAPRVKLDAIERLGAATVPLPFDRWWRVLRDHGHPGEKGLFVHPVADGAVIAGNGTVGLEILEQCPGVGTIVVPFGGGGLACGIAAAVKGRRPEVRVVAAEVETAAPLAASWVAGRPVPVERTPSFVDGIGAAELLPEMWPLVSTLLDGSVVVSLREVREAVRSLALDHHVVAEGAGAAALAAARSGRAGPDPVVAVISGGNIDAAPWVRMVTEPSGTGRFGPDPDPDGQ